VIVNWPVNWSVADVAVDADWHTVPVNEVFRTSPLAAVSAFDPLAGLPGPLLHGVGLVAVTSEALKLPLPRSVPLTLPLDVVWFCTSDTIVPEAVARNG
jgi:hypothetical protein